MNPRRKRRWWIRLVAFAAIGAVLCFFLPPVRAMFASTGNFVAWPGNERVRYEPGAEKQAAIVAAALPASIRDIERTHGGSFAEPVTVHVCASMQSFGAHGGMSPRAYAGGVVFNGRVFISPKPENTPDRLPRVLRHELSHLYLSQALGRWRFACALPVWFKEGIAVYSSHGGGAENVSEAAAWQAIQDGRAIAPRGRDNPYRVVFPNLDGLPAHLFYRESGMFVGYLARRRPAEFSRMLADLKEGASLAQAAQRECHTDLAALWEEFVRTGAPGSGEATPRP